MSDSSLIELAGRRFNVGPLRVAHLMEVERRLLAGRRDPLALLAERWNDFSDGQRRELLEAAFQVLSRPPTMALADMIDWMNSPEGTAYAFWLVAKDDAAELSWDECRELVMAAPAATLDEIQRRLAPELWERELGNSLGQAPFAECATAGRHCFAN